jgi:pantoate--beta-alanine ligase
MQRLTTIAETRATVARHRADGARIGFVPTMGFLHDGHLSLVRHAADLADVVLVSIFVNPAQFGPGEDLAAYPRDLAGDEAKLAGLGAAAPAYTFVPTVAEMYPRERVTTVRVAHLTYRLCGAARPGHFDGVATVVTKLFNIVAPDVAVFGRKDFQQLRVVQRMVEDLDQPVEVVGGPTVREPDGLAMSSRNTYLTGADRDAARTLSRALRTAVEVARDARITGRSADPGMIQHAARVTLTADPRVRVDYVEVLDADTLAPPDQPGGEGTETGHGEPDNRQRLLVAVAANVGPARLIDNVVIGDGEDEDRLLHATDSA